MSSLSTAVISLAIAAGVAGALAEVPGGDAARRLPEVPLAALAWAQLHCDSTLSARPATPLVQYEDFMRVTAAYDGIRIDEGLAVACDRAMGSARRVAQSPTLHP
jgi:hypothetical protein